MNLSEPLDGLVSKVESAVLRVLARTDSGFSGRQVHALAGAGSTSSVHRALARFVHIGLVTSEARPPAIIYRANRDHALWPIVERGLGARTAAFDSIRSFCEEQLSSQRELTVVVYGSVARRESTPESDIDLFVVHSNDTEEDARADADYRLADFTRRLTGNEAQVFSVGRAEVVQRVKDGDPLLATITADGILISGPALATAARTAA